MILILADPFHGHDCFILYLSAPSPSVEILHVHYMTKPLHKNPCPGGHEIYNFNVDSSLVIITKLSVCLISAWVKRRNFLQISCIFTIWLFWPHPSTKSCPGGHEIYNFVESFLWHHNYTLSLSNLCLGVGKVIFKEIMYFIYITYMATP